MNCDQMNYASIKTKFCSVCVIVLYDVPHFELSVFQVQIFSDPQNARDLEEQSINPYSLNDVGVTTHQQKQIGLRHQRPESNHWSGPLIDESAFHPFWVYTQFLVPVIPLAEWHKWSDMVLTCL